MNKAPVCQPEQRRTNSRFEIVLPAGMHDNIRQHLFNDATNEQLGVILAGVSKSGKMTKLLGREFIPAEPADLDRQSHGGVAGTSSFSQYLMQRCAAEGLSQIDVHSHPFGPSPHLEFSGTDDAHEMKMASYIFRHLPDTHYASIVMNQRYSRARVWLPSNGKVASHPIDTLTLAEFPFSRIDLSRSGSRSKNSEPSQNDRFDRQVRAFGKDGQIRMQRSAVTVIGAGGLGSILIEGLVRQGFRRIQIVDPDRAEPSNLNRVLGLTFADAKNGRPKADVAARMVRRINPEARVTTYVTTVFDEVVIDALKQSDLLVVATDNHASRLFAQQVACQYLIPLVNVGVHLEAADDELVDISGEFAVALPGPAGWCLSCARAFDPQVAAWELANSEEQQRWVDRGYIQGADVPSPAVRHLNGVAADLALAEIHNLFTGFKDLQSYVVYDQLKTEIMPLTIFRNPTCSLCCETGVLGLGDLATIPNYRHEPAQLPPAPEIDEDQLLDADAEPEKDVDVPPNEAESSLELTDVSAST